MNDIAFIKQCIAVCSLVMMKEVLTARESIQQHSCEDKEKMSLTCPWSSSSLLVSLSLSKLTTWRIHVSPEAGESGWMYTLGGTGESAFPATIHLELWYTYLQKSHREGGKWATCHRVCIISSCSGSHLRFNAWNNQKINTKKNWP